MPYQPAPFEMHPKTRTASPANKVLIQAYLLLTLALMESAALSAYAIIANVKPLPGLAVMMVYFALIFITHKTQRNWFGYVALFATTGWVGFTSGPLLDYYAHLPGGQATVLLALAGTAIIFMVMTLIAVYSKRDFGFLGKFLLVGGIALMVAVVANLFFDLPRLNIIISCGFLALSSLVILWQTSRMIHGGVRNPITAALSIFVHLYNILFSLLRLINVMKR